MGEEAGAENMNQGDGECACEGGGQSQRPFGIAEYQHGALEREVIAGRIHVPGAIALP